MSHPWGKVTEMAAFLWIVWLLILPVGCFFGQWLSYRQPMHHMLSVYLFLLINGVRLMSWWARSIQSGMGVTIFKSSKLRKNKANATSSPPFFRNVRNTRERSHMAQRALNWCRSSAYTQSRTDRQGNWQFCRNLPKWACGIPNKVPE